MKDANQIDILAIGVHPDDVELGCSGTLMKHIAKGEKVVVLDLTQGELGSRGTIDTRYQEADAAAKLMNIEERVNLKFRDGFFKNDEAHQLKLIEVIRHYRPRIVITNAYHDRHPDHGRASQLTETACFLSGLRKIITQWEGKEQEAWRPARVFHYIQDRYIQPDLVVDISEYMDQKVEAVSCYGTQFFSQPGDGEPETYISRSGFLEQIKARAVEMGHKIGTKYGEGFCCKAVLGVQDLDDLYYPEFS